ncbi:hypothetical protein BH10BAC5_BH10BAC5_25310 [soil metagenome]
MKILLIILLSLVLFSGCSKDDKPNDQETKTDSPQQLSAKEKYVNKIRHQMSGSLEYRLQETIYDRQLMYKIKSYFATEVSDDILFVSFNTNDNSTENYLFVKNTVLNDTIPQFNFEPTKLIIEDLVKGSASLPKRDELN